MGGRAVVVEGGADADGVDAIPTCHRRIHAHDLRTVGARGAAGQVEAVIGVGIAVLAWGTIGLYISDTAEKKLGFEPSEKEKQALEAVVPKITVVERERKS